MTDDLDMGAILNHYGLEETIRLAIAAGNDLAMICHRVDAVREAHGYSGAAPGGGAGPRPGRGGGVQTAPRAARSLLRGGLPANATRKSTNCAWTCSGPDWPRNAARRMENAPRSKFISRPLPDFGN